MSSPDALASERAVLDGVAHLRLADKVDRPAVEFIRIEVAGLLGHAVNLLRRAAVIEVDDVGVRVAHRPCGPVVEILRAERVAVGKHARIHHAARLLRPLDHAALGIAQDSFGSALT